MNKIILSLVACGSLLASNYRLVPLSSDGIALSSSNLAKSFSADAAFINPANMAYLGNDSKLYLGLTYYNVSGSRFTTGEIKDSTGDPYYNASDAHGKEYSFFLPTLSVVYPINDKHFIGVSAYTDFAAVYGWSSDYAKALTDNMNMRGGTAALSYAYKINDELSLGTALTLNYTKLEFNLIKDNAKNPIYPGMNPTTGKPYLGNGNGNGTWVDKDGKEHPLTWVYDGRAEADNGYRLGYKLSATYIPNYFDNKLRFSILYNSGYKNDFEGKFNVRISKFGLADFMDKLAQSSAAKGMLSDKEMLVATAVGTTLALDMMSGQIDTPVEYNGAAKVNFLYPANANLGMAYEYGKHEFMFNIGRTFWSKNKSMDLRLSTPSMPTKLQEIFMKFGAICKTTPNNCSDLLGQSLEIIKVVEEMVKSNQLNDKQRQEIQEYFLASLMNQSMKQNWKDTTLISLGYRYNYDKDLSLMFGFSTEDSPVRRQDISFLAKDSRMYTYSAGLEYRLGKELSVNLSGMYQQYADVSVHDVDNPLLKTTGDFKNQSNQLINIGINYEF